MFNPFPQEDRALNEAIASVYADLNSVTSDDEKYSKMSAELVRLYGLKHKTIDPNTFLTILGNLAIGIAVLKYEQTGIVTSKIWSFLSKM